MSRSISAGSSSRVDSPRAVISRRSGPPGRVPTSSRTPASAVSLASRRKRQGECGRVVGLVERVHRDRERLRPLQQPFDQAVKIGLRCPGRGGKCAHDLVGRGGAGVDRDVDGAGGQARRPGRRGQAARACRRGTADRTW